MQKGENPLLAIANAFMKIAEQIAAAVVEAFIFKALLDAFPALKGVFAAIGTITDIVPHAEGGITTGPHIGLVGEAGPEAIMPLSKLGSMLNTTFNAGAMSGNNVGSGNGQFVLKGNDLVLALQRSNYSLNLRRGA
jgi:phage-related minor tail protein